MKTTPEQFAAFDARVHHWWNLLGMDQAGYRLETRTEKLEGNRAVMRASHEGRVVDIVLSENMPKGNASGEQLDEAALHEVCHAFLLPLGALGFQRFVSEPELNHAEHEVTRRLQALILRLTKGTEE
jgi:hypothetical protein